MRYTQNIKLPIVEDNDLYSKEINNLAFEKIDEEIQGLADIVETLDSPENSIADVKEDVKKLKEQLNNITINIKDYGVIGGFEDNTIDETEKIQKAIGTDFTKYHTDQPLRKIIFERGKTYCVSSTIFVPPYTDIDFNGAKIKAIDGGEFTNGYMFSVNSQDCITWSFGYYPRVGEITNGIIDGNDLENVKGIFLCSNHRVTKMKFWKLYNSIYSPNIYIDNYFLEDIKINYPMGTDYQIYKSGQGDGIKISKVHTPSDIDELNYGNSLTSGGANILCIKQCGGGVIENIINGKIEIRTSYALNISNLHLETGSLEIYDSNCTVDDSIIFKRDEITNSAIYLDDNNYSSIKMGSKPVTLNNVSFLQYYKLSNYANDVADIDISSFNGNLNIINSNRRISDRGIKNTSVCGIMIKTGTKTLYNYYDITNIKGRNIVYKINNSPSSMSNYIVSISENPNITWEKEANTYYYNACFIIDDLRKIGRVTTNTTKFIANTNGAIIKTEYPKVDGVIRLYRGNSNVNFTEYVDIPNVMGVILDNGFSANGYAWKKLETPISSPEFQNIITGYLNISDYVTCRGSSVPTSGFWYKGDNIINNAPSEKGEVGNKYVINGWTCIADGTPGKWVQNRALTGN